MYGRWTLAIHVPCLVDRFTLRVAATLLEDKNILQYTSSEPYGQRNINWYKTLLDCLSEWIMEFTLALECLSTTRSHQTVSFSAWYWSQINYTAWNERHISCILGNWQARRELSPLRFNSTYMLKFWTYSHHKHFSTVFILPCERCSSSRNNLSCAPTPNNARSTICSAMLSTRECFY